MLDVVFCLFLHKVFSWKRHYFHCFNSMLRCWQQRTSSEASIAATAPAAAEAGPGKRSPGQLAAIECIQWLVQRTAVAEVGLAGSKRAGRITKGPNKLIVIDHNLQRSLWQELPGNHRTQITAEPLGNKLQQQLLPNRCSPEFATADQDKHAQVVARASARGYKESTRW